MKKTASEEIDFIKIINNKKEIIHKKFEALRKLPLKLFLKSKKNLEDQKEDFSKKARMRIENINEKVHSVKKQGFKKIIFNNYSIIYKPQIVFVSIFLASLLNIFYVELSKDVIINAGNQPNLNEFKK